MSASSNAEEVIRATFRVDDNADAAQLFGQGDRNLNVIEERFPVRFVSRGNELVIVGSPEEVDRVSRLLERLLSTLRSGNEITEQVLSHAIDLTQAGDEDPLDDIYDDTIITTARGRRITPKTRGQKEYLKAMRANPLAFAIGPAGTGKTFLAMAQANAALKAGTVNRIILTRPAVEAGEHLGFLPGDLQEKVDPYLRPLYDALYDIIGVNRFEKEMSRGVIEVAPLAYMRGRTLDDSFIILDEAQNTTPEQMKMFLTRQGFGSRVVVTGDITQIDLQRGTSGLVQVQSILKGIKGIEFVYLTEADVVRHPLVTQIIRAYERYAEQEE
ncbi:MAG: PhoH family protein [Bacillota bacterium]